MKITISEGEQVCANCKHFYQHYVKICSWYEVCNAGHCVYPRIKYKKPLDSCNKWAEKEGRK